MANRLIFDSPPSVSSAPIGPGGGEPESDGSQVGWRDRRLWIIISICVVLPPIVLATLNALFSTGGKRVAVAAASLERAKEARAAVDPGFPPQDPAREADSWTPATRTPGDFLSDLEECVESGAASPLVRLRSSSDAEEFRRMAEGIREGPGLGGMTVVRRERPSRDAQVIELIDGGRVSRGVLCLQRRDQRWCIVEAHPPGWSRPESSR